MRLESGRPFHTVARDVEGALRRHGFVPARSLDLDRQLLARIGGHLRPYRVLVVFCPATTRKILRDDPSAAVRSIVLVTVRDTGNGVEVDLPEPGDVPPAPVREIVADLHRRLGDAVREAVQAAGSDSSSALRPARPADQR